MAEPNTATVSSNLSCTICSEIYKSNEEVLSTNCGHVFHKTCYQEWMGRSQTCPECRSQNPQTQALYLHIEDPTEAENRNQRSQADLVKVSDLEKRLEESDQNFFDAQCALTFADEQIVELKHQLEFSNVLNSSYEQEQIQTKATLSEVQHALELSKKQLEELREQLEYLNVLNTSYEEAQAQAAEALKEAKLARSHSERIVEELQYENMNANCGLQLKRDLELSKEQVSKLNEELDFKNAQILSLELALQQHEDENAHNVIGTLKLQNEKQIGDLMQQHVEEKSTELENKLLLENQIKRLEAKMKNIMQELECEIENSTKLTVENIRLKKELALSTNPSEDKPEEKLVM